MKEEYRKARKEFAEAASGLEKEARTNAREAYERIKECADERMQAIKEGLREQGAKRRKRETHPPEATSGRHAKRRVRRATASIWKSSQPVPTSKATVQTSGRTWPM